MKRLFDRAAPGLVVVATVTMIGLLPVLAVVISSTSLAVGSPLGRDLTVVLNVLMWVLLVGLCAWCFSRLLARLAGKGVNDAHWAHLAMGRHGHHRGLHVGRRWLLRGHGHADHR